MDRGRSESTSHEETSLSIDLKISSKDVLNDAAVNEPRKVSTQDKDTVLLDMPETDVTVDMPSKEDDGGMVMPRRYQFRALSRKAVTYQSRQMFNNICCIGICPIAMILISVSLGALVQYLFNINTDPKDILYCSNRVALNMFFFPITSDNSASLPITPASTVPHTTRPVTHSNILRLTNLNPSFQLTQQGVSTSLTSYTPCVYNLGKRIDTTPKLPYTPNPEPFPTSLPLAFSDSTFLPQVNRGWISISSLQSLTADFMTHQKRVWYLVAVDPSINASALYGAEFKRNRQVFDISASAAALYAYGLPPLGYDPVAETMADGSPFQGVTGNLLPGLGAMPNSTTGGTARPPVTGLLNTYETRIFLDVDLNVGLVSSFSPVPYFESAGTSTSEMDALLYTRINQTVHRIANLDKRVLSKPTPSTTDLSLFLSNVSKTLIDLPYAGLHFHSLTHPTLSYAYTLHAGSDDRIDAGSGFPSKGLRQLLAVAQTSQALLRSSMPARLGRATITQTVRAMPVLQNTVFVYPFGSQLGRWIYPFGVAFLMPMFVLMMVVEKEAKIAIMLKMNGVSQWMYNLSNYVTFYILYAISALIFIVSGYIAKLEMFTLTSPAVLFLLFFFWGHAQISLSFFFSSIFRESRLALITVFLIVLATIIIGISIDSIIGVLARAPLLIHIWPPLSFFRALSLLNINAHTKKYRAYTFPRFTTPNDEVQECTIALIIGSLIYMIVAAYLSSVLPSGDGLGASNPWHWPITYPIYFLTHKPPPQPPNPTQQPTDNTTHPSTHPLIIRNIQKTYTRPFQPPKTAIHDFNLAVERNVVFGLLGPNGAGKTTLISVLTGVSEVTGGTALLAGYDLRWQREMVYRSIGVCPQYDILWDDLTVSEHLLFYARLKGIAPNDEVGAVMDAMKSVALESFKNRRANGLSGGEKRRLSIAIALVGNPGVVFLDEPTTGLDPEVRRLIWNIISTAKKGKTIILTTHSMEEAEVCCHRIGIMAQGVLRCLGSPLHLKSLYSTGFRLQFTTHTPTSNPVAVRFIEEVLRRYADKFDVMDRFSTTMSYEFVTKGDLAGLFEEVEKGKEDVGIRDWGLSQTTLEDVFVRLISEDDAGAD